MDGQTMALSRRSFIATGAAAAGGLMLGFHLPTGGRVPQAAAAEAAEVNAWIVIGTDDSVIIRVHRSEMGQGAFTAVPQLVAEELECDWTKVKPEFASPNAHVKRNKVYVAMGTGGSRTIRDSHPYLRKAGATAREMLIAAAAQQWTVPASECHAENGKVHHKASGRSVNYGAVAAAAAKLPPPADVKLKPHDQWKIVGQSPARFDIPSKVNGSAQFGMDVRVPDMLYAAAQQCPVFGGKVKSYDAAAVKGMPGVQSVVDIPNGVAVVARSYWQAKTALEALPIEWDEGENGKVSSESIADRFREGLSEPGATTRRTGQGAAALAGAAKRVEAEYAAPFLDHACMEPMNCTARINGDGTVEVWVSTQNGEAALAAAAEAAGVAPDKVEVYRTMLGGGFGRRGRSDYVTQAVHVAKAVGKPVKVIWSREEDMRHGFYRPASIGRLACGLDAQGNPVAWHHKVVGQSIYAYLLPHLIRDGWDRSSVEGTLHDQPYGIPNVQVDFVMRNTHVPVGFWRSVGHSQNAFINESFMDEVALAAGKDPYEFRRALLKDQPRFLRVLELAAEKSGWGKPLPAGRARGIAINESFGSIVAQVAEVSVDDRGKVHVHKITAALDCGHLVNPDTAKAQVESCVVYGLTALLYGEITIKDGRVEQGNFDDYEMLHIEDMPEVEVHFALSRGDAWGGIGEPGMTPTAPAVCNAIFAATGTRVRSLPLSHHHLRRA